MVIHLHLQDVAFVEISLLTEMRFVMEGRIVHQIVCPVQMDIRLIQVFADFVGTI